MKQVNVENHEYLTQEVFPRLGFDGVWDHDLASKMKTGEPTIFLDAVGDYGKDTMEYKARLDLNENDGRYYLNAIEAKVTNELGETHKHTFKLFSQKGYNADEMHRMMNGKYVYREFMNRGERTGRWTTVDVNKKDENGNTIERNEYDNTTKFNLVVELGKLPLVGMSQADKDALINDMRQGNPGETSIRRPDGSKERVELIPNPKLGLIEAYDMGGNRIRFDHQKIQSASKKFTVKEDMAENNKLSPMTEKLIEKAQSKEQGQSDGVKKKI